MGVISYDRSLVYIIVLNGLQQVRRKVVIQKTVL